jgi:O-antigen/teichoic acid export membrane protein
LNSLRANIVANFGGSLVAAVMGLLFIPLYIRFMGIEPYGLVGFYLTMQSVLSFLDAGMATTLNREFARLSATAGSRVQMRRLLRTFEMIYWSMALAGGGVIMLLARRIAVQWVQPKQLAVEDVVQAVTLMGFSFMVQWPLSLYSGGMQGLQRQVGLNVINAVSVTMRGVGATLVLWLISPTVQAFFTWQILVGVLHTAAIALVLWRRIGGTSGAGFDAPLLRSVWHFAAGMMAIGILGTVVSQLDKLILSRVLPLAVFGYYAFAGTVSGSLYRIITPIFSAVFPRFSQVVAEGNGHELASLYHRTAQTVAVVVTPAAIFIAFFSYEVLLLWTRDPLVAANTSPILSLLILGTAVSGVLSIPYAVQLAYGWTRVVLFTNIVAVVVLIPTVLLLALRFGARGAAFGWLGYNTVAALVVPGFMHRRILRGELSGWYLHDVGAPVAAAAVVALLMRRAIPAGGQGLVLTASLFGAATLVQIAAILAVPDVRRRTVAMIRGIGQRFPVRS